MTILNFFVCYTRQELHISQDYDIWVSLKLLTQKASVFLS